MTKGERRKLLLKEAKKFATKIAKDYKPQKIILFGSAVSGKITETSDVDLLVIKKTNERPIKRDQKVLRLLNPLRGLTPLDVVVCTPEEIASRSKGGDPFVLEVMEKGRVLHG